MSKANITSRRLGTELIKSVSIKTDHNTLQKKYHLLGTGLINGSLVETHHTIH